MFYNPDFIIYSSLGSFYIPCLVMIVLYTRIFRVGVSSSQNKTFILHFLQTLAARAQQNRSRKGPLNLQCVPTATALQPAALCHKVRIAAESTVMTSIHLLRSRR